MTTTIATLARKTKLTGSTGVTEDLAKTFYDNLETRRMAIVEIVGEHMVGKRGDRDPEVVLEIALLEVAEPGDAETHLRDLSRALYRQREPQQLAIDDNADDLEPTVAEVMAGDLGALTAHACSYPGCQLADQHDGDHNVVHSDS